MLHFKQSYQPENNGYAARTFKVFACAHCGGTSYRIDQDGDLSCVVCGRLLLFETKAVNGAPSLKKNTYDPDRLGTKSVRRHEVRYVGDNAGFKSTTIKATLRKPKHTYPHFEIECPYCDETVNVGFIAPEIKSIRRWRLRCANDHVVFVAPSGNGVPASWWA